MIDKAFIVERQGKSFVLYAGLLDLAHNQGLRRISTSLLQVPSEQNGQIAIVSAEVETERGTFSGIGDASPANVGRAMLTCTLRLAETRAKARALRDAVNVAVVALEELADADEPAAPIRPVTATPPVNDAPATPAQRAAVVRLAKGTGAAVKAESLTTTSASQIIRRLQSSRSAWSRTGPAIGRSRASSVQGVEPDLIPLSKT
jgi:hypothetical protein